MFTSLYTIKSGGNYAEIIGFGATLRSLVINGVDVVLGYDDEESYRRGSGYIGATVGRYANRIQAGRFTLDGIDYELSINNGKNHLHGGVGGVSKKEWELDSKSDEHVTLKTHCVDGEDGYPGELDFFVTYTLAGDSLEISYRALCDKRSVFCPTNHAYFNLNGCGNGDILDHLLKINSSRLSKMETGLIPHGEYIMAEEFDFREFRKIGALLGGNYDHNFMLDKKDGMDTVALLKTDKMAMAVITDMPALQLYTAGGLGADSIPLKGGAKKVKFGAVCLETQVEPNTPNLPEYERAVISPGKAYTSKTVYKFEY